MTSSIGRPFGTRRISSRLVAIVFAFAFAFLFAPAWANADAPRTVLVLNSYTPQYKWTDLLTQGIRRELQGVVPEERLLIEYMDARRMADDEVYFEQLFDLYVHKFGVLRPDVLLVADDSALTFALEHREALFPGVPIVFCGINSRTLDEVEAIPNSTGILEGLAVAENIELIRAIHPDTTRIVLLSDRTSLGAGMTRVARALIESEPRGGATIEIWDDYVFEDLVERVAVTPPGTVYLMLGIHQDVSGRYFAWADDTPTLTQRSNAPFYAMFGMVLGDGVVGGAMNDPLEHGSDAAALVRRILEGTPADAIAVTPSAEYRPRFDDAQLRRFAIDDSRLPPGSEIIGRKPSFYDQHRALVWSVLLVLASMGVAIVMLFRSTVRARRAEEVSRVSRTNLQVEVRERVHAEESMRFLAEAGRMMSESLDYPSTLASVAHLALGRFADCCIVYVLETDQAEMLIVEHVDPTKQQLLEQVAHDYCARWVSSAIGKEVTRSRTPHVTSDVTEADIRAFAPDDRHYALVRALGVRSAIALPLVARDSVIGFLGLLSTMPARRYGPDDTVLAQELARRAALSIDNARLYHKSLDSIRARDDFLMAASHELRTPLTPLLLQIEAFQRLLSARGFAELADRLNVSLRQLRRLSNLIEDVLVMSEIQAGRLTLDRVRVSLLDVARAAVAQSADQLELAGCSVSVSGDGALVGRWDKARLVAATRAILSNAAKFGAGAPIEVAVEATEEGARLTVRDHGIGIAPADRPRLFGRLVRIAPITHYGGLGLGLFIAREIVQAHGGQLCTEDAAGGGARVVMALPLDETSSTPHIDAPTAGVTTS
ncbi:MAG: GAF domain-containing protein [Polyangiaceae bacterium]|nr:GAF domain-containing protein [Polyangiaceae bacterium]